MRTIGEEFREQARRNLESTTGYPQLSAHWSGRMQMADQLLDMAAKREAFEALPWRVVKDGESSLIISADSLASAQVYICDQNPAALVLFNLVTDLIAAGMITISSPEMCGGCGNADPSSRCIGCTHQF